MTDRRTAPAGAANARTRGLALNEYKSEDLATMLDEPTPTNDQWAHEVIAQSQSCPLCFGAAVGHHTRKNGRVMLATYECGMTHRWNLTWVLAQVMA